MATNEADIAVRVGVNIADLVTGLNEATAKLDKFKGKVSSGAGGFAKYAAAATAAGVAVGAALVANAMAAVEAQQDLANQLNTSATSLANLKRAGELSGVSMGQIQAASKKLAITVAEASGGNEKAAETLSRLGFTAEQLAAMPLDQKIAAINEAIKQNIPATEQAAVAAQMFGSKAALAIQQLDSDAIAEGARQAQILGTALSAIESQQVADAADSMSLFGEAVNGAGAQLAAELAPYLQKAGEEFLAFAEKSGGMGEIISTVMSGIVKAIGFVADAFAGVRRVGVMVFESLSAKASKMVSHVVEAIEMMLKAGQAVGLDMGDDIEQLQAFQDTIDGLTQGSMARMNEALNEPLPSEKFEAWADSAKKASEEAAAAAIKAREEMAGQGGGVSGADLEAEKKDQEKKDRELERQRKHDENMARQRADQIANEMRQRQEQADQNISMMEYGFASEQEQLAMQLEERRAMIAEALELQRIDADRARELNAQAEEMHQKALTELHARELEERRRQEALELNQRVQMMQDSVGALMALAQGGGKKQFEMRKKLGIAQAMIGMYQGIAEGVALGYPMAIPAVAYATATGLAAINNIRKQTMNSGGGGAASAGGAAASAGAAMGGGNAAPQSNMNMFVQGINKNDLFTGQQLVEMINKAQQNGAVLRLA